MLFLILVINVAVRAQQFQNVLIGNMDSPEEISIAISTKDTNHIVAGANLNNAYYSTNGGYTWQDVALTSPYGVFGDPCLVTDTGGNFYFYHLAQNPHIFNWPDWADRVILQTSTDGGQTWDTGTYTGLNTYPKVQDKAWGAVDPNTNYTAVCWTQFDEYLSPSPLDSSRLMFSLSKGPGKGWSAPLRIAALAGDCADVGTTVEGCVPAFGLNEEIYATWGLNDTIYFNSSPDTGNTWMPREKAIATQPGGWAYSVPGLNRCNGMAVTMLDHSNSLNRGNLYVCWSDTRNGAEDADVFFIKSNDSGNTWSAPLRVNDDPPGKENFMQASCIDQATGDIYVLFFDRRNYSDWNTDVYMAYSFNGGNSFTNVKVSATPFMPDSNYFFGDYISISAHNGCVRAAWMRMDGGNTAVWEGIINKSQLDTTTGITAPLQTTRNYYTIESANPTTGRCVIHYTGGQPFDVFITDLAGRAVLQKHNLTETFYTRLDNLGLQSGTYLVTCRNEYAEKTFKIILMR